MALRILVSYHNTIQHHNPEEIWNIFHHSEYLMKY
jgi:hypothetical protein